MRLNLNGLQNIVKKSLGEHKAIEALRNEITRVFGPSVVAEGKIETVVAEANDWLDVLQRTGRDNRLDFMSNVTTAFMDHTNPELRRFAARVVPEKFLGKLTNDRDSAVRAAVAQRIPLPAVVEMMKKFRNDDTLRTIYRERSKKTSVNLLESGVKAPENDGFTHLNIHGDEAIGDDASTPDDIELSDAWYDEQANNFLRDYGQNIEYAWEELAVSRFCSSTKATSGVVVDADKLLKSVKKLIKDKEDLAMERNALKETLDWLKDQEVLQETGLPELDEAMDPVRQLVEANLTPDQYIERATELFQVQESVLPAAIRKYRLGESNRRGTHVPMIAWLPHDGAIRSIDERALDAFCESWNSHQRLAGEPIKIEWSTHALDMRKVGFSVKLS